VLERVLLTGVAQTSGPTRCRSRSSKARRHISRPAARRVPRSKTSSALHRAHSDLRARQPDESRRHPRHQPESVVGKAEAIRTALTWTGDALLAACLAPRCACCHCALESQVRVRLRTMLGRHQDRRRPLRRRPAAGDSRLEIRRATLALAAACGNDARTPSRCSGGRELCGTGPALSWRRLRRGFNQATELAAHLNRPVVHALWRVRPTASQTGLTAHARRRNVRGAFRLSPLLSAQKQARSSPTRLSCCGRCDDDRSDVERMAGRIDSRRCS
jgi:hypothetical protein